MRFFSGFNLSSRKICKPTNGWSVCEDIPEEIAKELERLNARYCVLSETLSGETPIKQSQTKIVNACGLIRGGIINSRLTHPAWTQVPTLFGWEYHAYTIAGNVAIQYHRIVFKGATNPVNLSTIVNELVRGASIQIPIISLTLLVTQTRLGRACTVHKNCLLENKMEMFPWVKPRDRIEELCNTALFQISNWNMMIENLKLEPWQGMVPASVHVSLSRRGAMTCRFTWADPGYLWESNHRIIEICEALGGLVKSLI